MSVWKIYGAGSAANPTSWRRYEYDGLNVLRVDERCDNNLNGLIGNNEVTWRTVEINTHKPGSLGALVGKRVYVYSDAADSSPNSSNDYTYTYDAVGNVQVIYRASGSTGQEAYFLTQDAFGNELSGDPNIPASNRTNLLGGATWATAHTAGITEHQTGKIQSVFSGLYYFHARWYDPFVGRFVGNVPIRPDIEGPYIFCENSPVNYVDVEGLLSSCSQAEVDSQLKGLRNAMEVMVEYVNSWPWVQRPSGCTSSWSFYIYGAGVEYLASQKKQCWDGRVVAGFQMIRDPRYPRQYYLGTRHQVTEWKNSLCDNSKDFEDPSNVVFDAWTYSTPFTGIGTLQQYTMAEFRYRYPIDTGIK